MIAKAVTVFERDADGVKRIVPATRNDALPDDVDPTPEPDNSEVIEEDEPMLWAGGDE